MAYGSEVVSLFFNLNRTLEISSVTFDAFITEEHSKSQKLTEIVIEDGSIINDHIVKVPRKLNIRAVKSNTPIFYGGALSKALSSSTDYSINQNASAIEWVALIDILDEREPISIVTVLEKYDNMILTDIATMTDKDTSETLIVDMTFQELRTVSVREEQLSAENIKDDAISRQASKNKTQGSLPLNEGISESWLCSITGICGG